MYSRDIQPWPMTVEKVDKGTYVKIQGIVRRFIAEKRSDAILPVQFDDIYWRLARAILCSSIWLRSPAGISEKFAK